MHMFNQIRYTYRVLYFAFAPYHIDKNVLISLNITLLPIFLGLVQSFAGRRVTHFQVGLPVPHDHHQPTSDNGLLRVTKARNIH